MCDHIVTRPDVTGRDHPDELERCGYCGRVHPAVLPDAHVRWCGGLLGHSPRWLIVELEPEAVAA